MRAKFGVQKQTCGIRLRAKFCLDQFILSNSIGENPHFYFFGLRHLVVSPVSGVASWQQSDKVGHGCTTTNLPLSIVSNGIKIVSVFQRHHGENGRTISDVQKA